MDVEKNVQGFFEEFSFGRSENDNFAPWWLSKRFSITPQRAMGLSSDGSADFGLDAYYVNKISEEQYQVYLIQAKYSDDLNLAKTGIKEFKKIIPIIHCSLTGGELTSNYENVVVQRLNSDLKAIVGKHIHFQFHVITLSKLEPEIMDVRTQYSRKEINEEIGDTLRKISNITWDISCLTIKNILPETVSTFISTKPDEITFDGSDKLTMGNSYFMSGIGRLCDLVKLYETYNNQLFEKNVRFYLYSKKNEESDPAGKIKDTLRDIVVNKKKDPQFFAFLHNGVTIFTKKIERIDGKLLITSPIEF